MATAVVATAPLFVSGAVWMKDAELEDGSSSSSSNYATSSTRRSAHRLHTDLLCIVRGGNQRGKGETLST